MTEMNETETNEYVIEDANEEKIAEPIKTERTKGHVLDVSSGFLAVELPAGYIYEGKAHVDALVREMRGHEEDILASKGPIVTRLNAVIGNCLVKLGDISESATLKKVASALTGQDRMAVMIAIRRASLGDFYDCNVKCPECKIVEHRTIDLKDVEISAMPDRLLRDRCDELPSGTEVKWHVINSADEDWLSTVRKKKQDQLTLGLLARVDAVGDIKLEREKKYRKALVALKDLSTRDRVFLRSLFDKEEGKVDTDVEFECEECGHIWTAPMDMQEGFFFPSAL